MESTNAPATDVETKSMLQKLEGLKNHLISMSCVDPEDVETQQNYELDAIDIIRGNPHLLGLGELEAFNAMHGAPPLPEKPVLTQQ